MKTTVNTEPLTPREYQEVAGLCFKEAEQWSIDYRDLKGAAEQIIHWRAIGAKCLTLRGDRVDQ